nr:cyclin dependent kinase 1 [Hymenolepis microstoma]
MVGLEKRFSNLEPPIEEQELDFLQTCFQLNPADRATTEGLLKHKFLEEASHLVSNSRLSPTLSQSKSLPSLSLTPSGYTPTNDNPVPLQGEQNLSLCSPGDIVPRKPKVVHDSIYQDLKGWPHFDKSGPVNNFGVTGASMTGNLSKTQVMFCQRITNINGMSSKAQNKTVEHKKNDISRQRMTKEVSFKGSRPNQENQTPQNCPSTQLSNFPGPNCISVFPTSKRLVQSPPSTLLSSVKTTSNESSVTDPPPIKLSILPLTKLTNTSGSLQTISKDIDGPSLKLNDNKKSSLDLPNI